MTSFDFDRTVAVDLTGGAAPYAWGDGIVTRTAAKHIAEEGVSIGGICGTALGIVTRGTGVNIVNGIVVPVVRPVVAIVELVSDGSGERAVLDGLDGSIPLSVSVDAVPFVGRTVHVVADTDLAAGHLDTGVAQHQAVFGAAIGRGGDQATADLEIGGVGHSEADGQGVGDGVGQALSSTEDIAIVIQVRDELVGHQSRVDTNLAAGDQHLGQARVRGTRFGNKHGVVGYTRTIIHNCVEFCKVTYRAQLAATVHGVAHLAAPHID